ncbi:MAG: transposase [Opitutaceae bacterium]|jgi:putative transposase|nr:transposase [Opitutaceae bacterium]
MARKLRIQYPGAIYHVLNRGNYKSDIFADQGAAHAFVQTLEEAVERFGWRLGAYVVMRNHYHLSFQTPEPNLAAGMHWLQCTFATRFNRLRNERGHLFQGRYKAILLETDQDWARVVDYIHLNPIRAGIVTPDHMGQFRWSSLARFHKNMKFNGLSSLGWLNTHGLEDTPKGWDDYIEILKRKHGEGGAGMEDEDRALSSGWAVGSDAWKVQTLKEALPSDETTLSSEGLQVPPEMLRVKWKLRLDQELEDFGKSRADLEADRKSAAWKIQLADRLQRENGASVTWIAAELRMGKPNSVRAYLWKLRNN